MSFILGRAGDFELGLFAAGEVMYFHAFGAKRLTAADAFLVTALTTLGAGESGHCFISFPQFLKELPY